jgi:nitrite reductase/ring-hydroxylating ferredoxin subunit
VSAAAATIVTCRWIKCAFDLSRNRCTYVNGKFVMRSGIFDESEFTVCQCSERVEVQLYLCMP